MNRTTSFVGDSHITSPVSKRWSRTFLSFHPVAKDWEPGSRPTAVAPRPSNWRTFSVFRSQIVTFGWASDPDNNNSGGAATSVSPSSETSNEPTEQNSSRSHQGGGLEMSQILSVWTLALARM